MMRALIMMSRADKLLLSVKFHLPHLLPLRNLTLPVVRTSFGRLSLRLRDGNKSSIYPAIELFPDAPDEQD
jgi:hypothetical protein